MVELHLAPIGQKNPKAVCHLNQALRVERLCLVLGAGVSTDLHLPKWDVLLGNLEDSLQYPKGEQFPASYRAEQLFQLYKHRSLPELETLGSDKIDAAVGAGWRGVVASALYNHYAQAGGTLNAARYSDGIAKHPYLKQLAHLASKLSLVITHNFDDALEWAIEADETIEAEAGRRYHSFWKPEPFLRRSMVNIYHPNGFTPFREGVKGSDSIILTEQSFADHLANTNTAETNFLLRHLADKTCLIVGHSLSDGTLKNALRIHANQRPGHVNYYIHWLDKNRPDLSDEQRNAIREANFVTYNLVTIFANSDDIRQLLEIIGMEEETLEGKLEHLSIDARYVYYISGAVSSGKSTILGHLRDLATVEEWPSRMPTDMAKPSTDLDKDTEQTIDERLEEAIWTKNDEVRKTKVGLVAVDRAPLDFLAFPGPSKEAAAEIAKKRTPRVLKRLRKNNFARLCQGHVIVVSTQTEVLVERQLLRGRIKPPGVDAHILYLGEQQNRMREIYSTSPGTGTVVETDPCSIGDTVRYVAREIHFGTYKPFDFSGHLRNLNSGKSGDAH